MVSIKPWLQSPLVGSKEHTKTEKLSKDRGNIATKYTALWCITFPFCNIWEVELDNDDPDIKMVGHLIHDDVNEEFGQQAHQTEKPDVPEPEVD